MKSFLVIGLGRFGAALAQELFSLGHEVLAVDSDPAKVDEIADSVTQAIACDAQDLTALKELGASGFDCAVVAAAGNIASSSLVTLNLKELGVPAVICKARSFQHKRLLEKIGADRVIFPEHDFGASLARSLTGTDLSSMLQLSEDYSLAELTAPAKWVGKSIIELDVRRKYKVNIIAIRANGEEKMNISPEAAHRFAEGERVTILGSNDAIRVLREL